MKLAIHKNKNSFSKRWIVYCERENIDFIIVNAYSNTIIQQLEGCNAFLWHHGQSNPKDVLFAKQLLYSIEKMGISTFPNFNTTWHFDDKVGQKYLLEAINAPVVKSYVFYSKKDALKWIQSTSFPKVFKLRGGAGSKNVMLAKTSNDAVKLIKKAFGKGFRQYEPLSNLKERWRMYKEKKTDLKDVLKGMVRFFNEPEFSKVIGYERGYIYFQDFIPNNEFDIRIIVIGNRAFALKRMVRKGDFKASGSGDFKIGKDEFDSRCISISFDSYEKLGAQCVAFDYIFNESNDPLIVEISYGFSVEVYDACPGYWDKKLDWHEGSFDPQSWMIENIINQ